MYYENVPDLFIYLSIIIIEGRRFIDLFAYRGKPYQFGMFTIKTFLAYLFIYFVEGRRCIDLFSYREQTWRNDPESNHSEMLLCGLGLE